MMDMRLYNEHKERMKRLEDLQNQRVQEEKECLQPKPLISPKSQKIA